MATVGPLANIDHYDQGLYRTHLGFGWMEATRVAVQLNYEARRSDCLHHDRARMASQFLLIYELTTGEHMSFFYVEERLSHAPDRRREATYPSS